jgi:RimJ/RimL family protein N-acetyltransferase
MTDYPALETERLLLRPVTIEDAAAMQLVFPQWEIVRWLDAGSVPWPYPPDGCEVYLRNLLLPRIERGEQWSWTIRRKDAPGQLIGVITLTDGEDDNRGFWLDPAFHGQGLMSEAVEPVTDYWFDVLGRLLLRIPKAADNVASRRISEKQGMRRIATIEKDYVGGRMPSDLWEITAEEWRARRS